MSINFKKNLFIKVISIDVWNCFDRGMAGFDKKNNVLISRSTLNISKTTEVIFEKSPWFQFCSIGFILLCAYFIIKNTISTINQTNKMGIMSTCFFCLFCRKVNYSPNFLSRTY